MAWNGVRKVSKAWETYGDTIETEALSMQIPGYVPVIIYKPRKWHCTRNDCTIATSFDERKRDS
jgi:hypothetical protein